MSTRDETEIRRDNYLATLQNLTHARLENVISTRLLVKAALRDGASWRAIGAAVGTSGQAAWEKYRPEESEKVMPGQGGLFID
jgi:hypothetical protein